MYLYKVTWLGFAEPDPKPCLFAPSAPWSTLYAKGTETFVLTNKMILKSLLFPCKEGTIDFSSQIKFSAASECSALRWGDKMTCLTYLCD